MKTVLIVLASLTVLQAHAYSKAPTSIIIVPESVQEMREEIVDFAMDEMEQKAFWDEIIQKEKLRKDNKLFTGPDSDEVLENIAAARIKDVHDQPRQIRKARVVQA